MIELINSYLPLLGMVLGGFIWFLRLEGRVNSQEKEIQAFAQIMKKLSEIAERLSFIEGNLKAHGRD